MCKSVFYIAYASVHIVFIINDSNNSVLVVIEYNM